MTIYDFNVKTRTNEDFSLKKYKGKIIIIVNTATGCGFTPQYEALETLYEKYHDQGLEIMDFPCNQFGHQAPGTDDEIHDFCTGNYNTKFDQFAKIDVNGEKENSLFTYIKKEMPNDEINGLKNKMAMKGISKMSPTTKKEGDITWNFTKFLVDKEGKVIKRLAPIENPILLEEDIKKLIKGEIK